MPNPPSPDPDLQTRRRAGLLRALASGERSGARSIDLSHCGLTRLPDALFEVADSLEVLDLSGNALCALPDAFVRFVRLRVLFCSGNRFERLPPVLGACPDLSQLGFRQNAMAELPAEALPPRLRWLTLTDNRIERLPDAIGERPELQKLLLSGNRLRALPDTLSAASRLELLRLGANALERLPSWLVKLPSLAWLAWAGNPLGDPLGDPLQPPAHTIDWAELTLGARLGEGASGVIHAASWRPEGRGAPPRDVAVKLFKGAMTSDGLPEREIAACLAAGDHPRLTGGLGQIAGHPDQATGLVMPLLPDGWRALAGPPSLESCSRDVYDPALRLAPEVVLRLAGDVGEAVVHLHGRGLLHGDVYAHNTLWDGESGRAVLSDLGAASFLGGALPAAGAQRLEVLAWGRLLGELLDRCPPADRPADLEPLRAACLSPDVLARPDMAEALAELRALS